MSDGYLGLDQQYDIPLKVIPATHLEEEEEFEEKEEEEEVEKMNNESSKKWLPPAPGKMINFYFIYLFIFFF